MCFSRLTNGVIKMSFCTRIESLPAKCCFQVRWRSTQICAVKLLERSRAQMLQRMRWSVSEHPAGSGHVGSFPSPKGAGPFSVSNSIQLTSGRHCKQGHGFHCSTACHRARDRGRLRMVRRQWQWWPCFSQPAAGDGHGREAPVVCWAW